MTPRQLHAFEMLAQMFLGLLAFYALEYVQLQFGALSHLFGG
jgi:hypothetical protein